MEGVWGIPRRCQRPTALALGGGRGLIRPIAEGGMARQEELTSTSGLQKKPERARRQCKSVHTHTHTAYWIQHVYLHRKGKKRCHKESRAPGMPHTERDTRIQSIYILDQLSTICKLNRQKPLLTQQGMYDYDQIVSTPRRQRHTARRQQGWSVFSIRSPPAAAKTHSRGGVTRWRGTA